ncbi:MAG: ABC transporter ATP-binding protein [Actinomycetaceae bacterium]|nr:ABC transporter ATP-binding protein [Actinomycetaceae bacterium]
MTTKTTINEQPEPLLELVDLEVAFKSSTGMVPAVRKANLTIYPGQSIAIVGESGSGKSTTAHAVIGLLPGTGRVTGGKILFKGEDIAGYTEKQMVRLRGDQIGLVPQDPMSNLNPVYRIGKQVEESLIANNIAKGSDVHKVAIETLEHAGLDDAARRSKQYPHEFSGGMRQRALIAMGLAAKPDLLIADEPTSALDVTVQRRILDHLQNLTAEMGTAVMFITHDLGLAAERAEHLVVMHRGRIVESGPSLQILRDPQHPYTQRLVKAAPSLASARIQSAHAKGIDNSEDKLMGLGDQKSDKEVIRVENLTKIFDIRGAKGADKQFKAVDNVSFTLRRGTTLALVGESGSGKSTVANIVLNLIDPTEGKVYYEGTDLSTLDKAALFAMRRKLQVVFQNPYGSLDPTFTVFRCIEEPLRIHKTGGDKKARENWVAELLDLVSLPRSAMRRYPDELSGGQRQRVAIARALALKPEVVVLDEAVSALDVLVQDQILHLLNDLQAKMNLSYLFITHDLAVVRENADDIVVMEHGKVVEQGPADDIFDNPQQAYTRELIEAVPGGSVLAGRSGYHDA